MVGACKSNVDVENPEVENPVDESVVEGGPIIHPQDKIILQTNEKKKKERIFFDIYNNNWRKKHKFQISVYNNQEYYSKIQDSESKFYQKVSTTRH